MEKNLIFRKDNCIWDFVLLNPLTEETFLKTLTYRYKQDQIYTYIGNELVSVNPYKNLEIYNEQYALAYLRNAPFKLPPHIFSIMSTAYKWLKDTNEDQCIIMSGESGSGKTEVFKKMLDFLSIVIDNQYTDVICVKHHIKHANVILEAFGHAETTLNKNSSRFGKFLDMEFDFKGDPVSVTYTSYLLDKDRIISQSFGERNFHIFYQILCGADIYLLKILKLHKNVLTYSILKNGGTCINFEQDKLNFLLTKKSLNVINFSYELLINIFKIVAVVLKLGNISFMSITNIDGTEGCTVSNEYEVYDICQLLGINVTIFKTVVTCRRVYILRNLESSFINIEMSADEASHFKDCLCKALYSRLFIWLVKTINSKIKSEPRYKRRHLCFLDMFGFENFNKNRFHQFVINYCNEKLFQTVFEANFRSEQEEYIREGIQWTQIDYNGNFTKYKFNDTVYEELFLVLDRSSNELKDSTSERYFMQKLKKFNLISNCESYSDHFSETERLNTISFTSFSLKHYVCNVTYNSFDFIHKNSDVISMDLSTMLYEGTHPLLKSLFPEGSVEMASLKKKPSPVSKQIKIALNGILRNLQNKKLHYIRCFKPNELQGPHILETDVVLNQIRSQKIIESVRLRRNGFSFSLPQTQFLNRYKILSLKTWPISHLSVIENIQYLLHDLPIPAAEFAFGTTKMFIRSPRSVYELEEYRRQRLNDIAVIIQTMWRTFYQRRKFLKIKRSQIIIVTAWRKYQRRKKLGINKGKKQIDWAIKIIQRHYIQWKRYQFLKRLICELRPRTMSPLNQDWPSCNIRLAETSLLLRKLHHKWRCQQYRSQFNQTMRNKMREKVTASILFKDKKYCYAESVSKPFVGDYVRLRKNSQWKKICSDGNDQYVVFADIINKITRSTGKFIPMLLVISTNSLIIMDPRTLDIKYRIPASEIYRISLSPFEDNIAVIHICSGEKNLSNSDVSQCFSSSSTNISSHAGCFFVNDYYEKGDIIFQTSYVIEVVTKLFLVIQNAVGRPSDINISPLFNTYFHHQIVTISFYYVTSVANLQSESVKIVRRGNRMEISILKN